MSGGQGKTKVSPSNSGGISRLANMQAQFQQKQMQEKEHKLLQMLDTQQQRGLKKAGLTGVIPASKYSNGSSPAPGPWSNNSSKSTTPTRTSPSVPSTLPPGKVRQMFEERRKGGSVTVGLGSSSSSYRAGIDKSYPLEPIEVSAKSRSSSSKSDPPKSQSVAGQRLTKPPAPARSPQDRTTPSPTVGASDRGTRSGYSSIHGHRKTPEDENGNDLDSSSNAPVPMTTKYKDYINGFESKGLSSDSGQSVRGSDTQNIIKARAEPGRKSVLGKPTTQNNNARLKSTTVPAGKVSSTPSPVQRSAPLPGMEECRVCHRHFANDRVAKHESICKKTTTKKRKVFDPTKMRMQGTEAEPYLRVVSGKAKKPAAAAAPAAAANKKVDWRKKHEEFINTIRAAKVYQQHVANGGNPADLPPPPPSDNSDYVQCPHCGRKFNAGVAERHIPKCQSIKSNKRR